MSRSLTLLFALATTSAAALAQSAVAAGQEGYSTAQMQPAPIVRAYAGGGDVSAPAAMAQAGPGAQAGRTAMPQSTQPIAGVMVRAEASASVKTVSADAKGTELRIEHGRVNINVRNPAADSSILVDLPGGQVSLLKNGVYTFNAETNTLRVIDGEAETYVGSGTKPITVKEDHQLVLDAAAKNLRPVEVGRNQLFADLLPGGTGEPRSRGYGGGGYGYPGAYYAPYGDGFYGAPYAFGYGYPYGYGFGYPYGYGFGLGFGYYGGFRGGYGGFGGFRGGYGGFRGRGR